MLWIQGPRAFISYQRLPQWHGGKESACQCMILKRQIRSLFGKIPRSRKWQPSRVFLSGKFHGQRSLQGCSPWVHKESDITGHTHTRCQCSFRLIQDLRFVGQLLEVIIYETEKWVSSQNFDSNFFCPASTKYTSNMAKECIFYLSKVIKDVPQRICFGFFSFQWVLDNWTPQSSIVREIMIAMCIVLKVGMLIV